MNGESYSQVQHYWSRVAIGVAVYVQISCVDANSALIVEDKFKKGVGRGG